VFQRKEKERENKNKRKAKKLASQFFVATGMRCRIFYTSNRFLLLLKQ
jgi:hypothetical protein